MRTFRYALLRVGGLALVVTACASSSEQPASTSIQVETSVLPTSAAVALQLSRETLLAVGKCASDSATAYLWAEESPSLSRLDDVAELCEDAIDQLEVDRRILPEANEDIGFLILEVGLWTLMIREQLVALSSGLPADVGLLQRVGPTIETRLGELLDELQGS